MSTKNLIINNIVINNVFYRNRRRKRQIFDNGVVSAILRDELTEGLQSVDIGNILPPVEGVESFIEPECEDIGPCDSSSPFRTLSGHCNNIRNPAWGKSLTVFSRLLPSVYEDGKSTSKQL